jgi:glyoxylate/hydroxypyruvate reductase A
MSRLLLHADRLPDAFALALKAHLPDREILLEPPQDGEAVPYLVAGRPPAGLVASLKGLKLILSLNAGVEALLDGGEAPPGVGVVKMADEGLRRGMVEWVLAHTLAWHRNLWTYRADQAQGLWRPRPEKIAPERQVCVLGAGSLGAPVAAALVGLGFQTRVWSRSGAAPPGALGYAGLPGLDAALEGADVLICLLPKTQMTEDLLDRNAFARLAPGALFVNAGRGAVVVEADLLEGLKAGRPGFAVLDVFRGEPLASLHPFWRHPQIMVSPHVAAETRPDTAAEAIAASILRFERGQSPGPLASGDRGY